MSAFQDKKALYFEKIGENFDLFMSEYDVCRRAYIIRNLILKRIPNALQLHALETGCGTGKISVQLKDHFNSYSVSDLSAKLARSVSEKYICNSLVIDVSDEEDCRRHLGNYDVIISSEVIEHTPLPEDSVVNTLKMIKNDGYILLTTPNKLWYPVLLLAKFLRLRKFQGNESWLWPFEIVRLVEANDFQVLEKRGCHLFPWQIPLAKKLLPYFDKFGGVLYPCMINFVVLAKRNRRQS